MNVTAGHLITDAALRHADRLALTTAQGSQTFGELDHAADRVASGLAAIGLKVGDRVAVLSHNRAEVVHAWLGCERAGLVRVVLHSHFEMPVHVELMRHVGARALIFDSRFADEVSNHRASFGDDVAFIAVGDRPPTWALSWSDVVAQGEPVRSTIEVDEAAPAFIQPTTGTTGTPKPWIVTHRSWRAIIDQNLHHLDTFAAGISGCRPAGRGGARTRPAVGGGIPAALPLPDPRLSDGAARR